MTLQRLRAPVLVGVAVALYAWVLSELPPAVSVTVRAVNGFVVTVFLVWFWRRVDRLLNELIEIVLAGERSRASAFEALESRADKLAAEVARVTAEREVAQSQALDRQTEQIVSKIEERR